MKVEYAPRAIRDLQEIGAYYRTGRGGHAQANSAALR